MLSGIHHLLLFCIYHFALPASPAAELGLYRPPNGRFVETPLWPHEISRGGIAAQALNHDVSRKRFEKIDRIVNILGKLRQPDTAGGHLVGQHRVPHGVQIVKLDRVDLQLGELPSRSPHIVARLARQAEDNVDADIQVSASRSLISVLKGTVAMAAIQQAQSPIVDRLKSVFHDHPCPRRQLGQ
jgi:hypothetical protein